MNIIFTIHHPFLVSHFPKVRNGLMGVSVVEIEPELIVPYSYDWPDFRDYENFELPTVFSEDNPNSTQIQPQTRLFELPSFKWPSLTLPSVTWPVLTLPKFKRLATPRVVKPEPAKSRVISPGLSGTAKAWILNLVIAVAMLVGVIVFLPEIYYTLAPADTTPIAKSEDGSPLGGSFDRNQNGTAEAEVAPTPRPLPPKDESLPEGEWIIIPRIGVRTQLQATVNADEALDTGVWMEPDYGRPGALDKPLIAAAHRFGWQWWWKDDYWKYHSFYLLPDLQPGDIIETISDQRKYYYEVYAGEEGEEITDYTADMILYTCKFLNSPLRHIRYARLIDMEQNTQVSAAQ